MTNDERDALIKKAAEAMVEYDNPGVYERGDVIVDWDDYVGAAEAALAVFEEAHTLTECLDCGRTDGGCDRIMDTPTDDERMAAHKEAKKRYGRGEQQVRRRVAFEDGAAWAALHRPVQAEPTDAQVAAAARAIFSGYVGETSDGFDKPTYAYDREKAEHVAGRALRAALKEGSDRG